jgi:hypothetical protein
MRKRSSKKTAGQEIPTTSEPASEKSVEAPLEDGESTTADQSPPGVKNPAAVALGRLGGKKGGLARAKKLTKEQRSEIARKAAEARWRKRKA